VRLHLECSTYSNEKRWIALFRVQPKEIFLPSQPKAERSAS
jgi:hypothetical protein